MQDVKLGLAVVYLLDESASRLLDVHLTFIERHTRVPYRIYAACNRLGGDLRKRLERPDRVTICAIKTTPLRGVPEHQYYLSRLVQAALDDGCTHVAILHVDSFPVREGWFEELHAKLNDSCPVASVMMKESGDHKPHTCFLLFSADFFRHHAPSLLLSTEDLASPEYAQYASTHPHQQDNGCGIGFLLYRKKLDWVPLLRSNAGNDHEHMGSIYGDMIFHLSGVARDAKIFNRALKDFYSGSTGGLRRRINALMVRLVPQGLLYSVKENLARFVFFRSEHRRNAGTQQRILSQLSEDPEGYIHFLRTGQAPGKSMRGTPD
jgi:hypothetical protein